MSSDDDDAIFIGKEYHGEGSGKRKSTTGKENIYVRISNPGSQRKPNSELSSKGLNLRVRLSVTPLVQVQNGNINGDELLPLLFRMIRKNAGMFWKLIEMGKYSLSKMLTVSQLVDVLLNLPMATIRRMRTLFLNFGFIIFLSEEKMRSEMSKRVQHLEEADMKFEKIFLYPVGGEYGLTEIDLLYSGDLVKYMEGVYDKLESDYYDNPDSTIKINLSGDKGGKSMKFHFEIWHPSSSVFDIHLFCMYEGSDCLENMTKVLGKFAGAFQAMADPGFKLRGRKVEFFLGGDFKFLDGVIGTQGSSAKMPCSKFKVGLDHLKNHGGAKYGPEFCQLLLMKWRVTIMQTWQTIEGIRVTSTCVVRGSITSQLKVGIYLDSFHWTTLFPPSCI